MVLISVGPSRDNLTPARVNDAEHPHWVSGEHFRGFVTIRVREYEQRLAGQSPARIGHRHRCGEATVPAPLPQPALPPGYTDCEQGRAEWEQDVKQQRDAYFQDRRRLVSIQWCGQYLPTRPTADGQPTTAWTGNDILFTTEADHSEPLPWVGGH